TGKSLEQIGQMSLSARASMLTEVSSGNEELVFQLTRASEKISIANNPEASAEKLLLAFSPNEKAQRPTLVHDVPAGKEALGRALKDFKPGDTYRDMGFRPIEMKDSGLSHTIVMSRFVTEKQWVELMGNNPSMIPRNTPVEVERQKAFKFANQFSESQGLKPAYDLSTPGEVRVNAPRGDIYRAEGFRLMTSEEYESIILKPARESQIKIEDGRDIYGHTGKVEGWGDKAKVEGEKDFYNVQEWGFEDVSRGWETAAPPLSLNGMRFRLVRTIE
ncbi:MAG: hypothetical protein OXB88_04850, partial [Bacteriovoracales bacterium]|nr:hypothetical protein [Bacteriovoracales bacterium]